MLASLSWAVLIIVGLFLLGFLAVIAKMYKKAVQGEALLRTGMGDAKVSFSGIIVVPILHKLEVMDIKLKAIVISRSGAEGLVCKDNMRADVKVNFFVRVNKTHDDVVNVAPEHRHAPRLDPLALESLFDAKFSEGSENVGKQFDFIELYNSREQFKQEILRIIGTDLNGYVLDDCAIDYLEQTPLHSLNQDNILDAEGIKKIISLTSEQKIQANQIQRDQQKTIKKQDVEAQETILQLEKQLAETQEKQYREIANIKAREAPKPRKYARRAQKGEKPASRPMRKSRFRSKTATGKSGGRAQQAAHRRRRKPSAWSRPGPWKPTSGSASWPWPRLRRKRRWKKSARTFRALSASGLRWKKPRSSRKSASRTPAPRPRPTARNWWP
jgi:uncharacterized membrane protein YqiK